MRKHYVGLKLHKELNFDSPFPFEVKPILPDGCVGVLFVFGNKKKGKAFLGKDTIFEEIIPVEES